MPLTLYNILEIEQDASPSNIKSAYYKLARKFHPDKNSDPDAIQQFQKIGYAYEVLSDELRRKNYDRDLKNNSIDEYNQGSSYGASYYSTLFRRVFEEREEEEIKAKNLINKVFGSFDSLTKEQQLVLLKENRSLLREIYHYCEPYEFHRVIQFYPISELIHVLKIKDSPLSRLAADFNADKCCALLERLSPEQRWCTLDELEGGIVLKVLIKHNREQLFSSYYKDALAQMILSPQLYFEELNQHIENLDVSTEINAKKLAKALRVLSVDLAKDVAEQEKNQKLPEIIQYSNAMKTLRETILMVRSIRSLPPANALEAIKRYEKQCASKSSAFSRVIGFVIFAAIGLVVGALIGMIISLSMGVGVLPIIAGGVAGSVLSGGISKMSGASDALNKHRLFQTKLEHEENNVAQAAYKYCASSTLSSKL